MKMPNEAIDPAMFAPCGMNCLVCYRHCRPKKPCAGCRGGDSGKPGHCRRCSIKDCAAARGWIHCLECPDYPCQRIKALDTSYRKRYRTSLMENSACVRQYGLERFMELQKARYTCPSCGGVCSLHDGACSECRTAMEDPAAR